MGYLGPSLRRAKRIERPLRRAAYAVLGSLALNAALFLLLVELGAFRLPAPMRETRVALAPLSASQWESNRAVARGLTPPPAAARPPAPPEPEQRLQGHVVELNPSQKAAEKAPANARFLSDRNTQVEKETVSRFAGAYPRLAPKPEAGQEGKQAAAAQPPKPRSPADVKPGGTGEGKPGKEGAPGERVALANPGEGTRSLREPQLGEGGEGGRPGAAPDLSVAPETLQRLAGGPNMDGVREGLPEGDETWLNAREFKYATFMNRMRAGIAAQWYPMVREATKQRDPDGSIYFSRERTVVLALVLDTSGNLRDLSVKQSSNLEFFDRIAMTSVRQAQPFPNPPSGMFHGDEQVSIPFSFTMFPGDHRGLLFWRPPTE